MADKAYSSAANRACLRRRGIQAVIPVKEDQKKNRRARGRSGGRPPAFDPRRDKERKPSNAVLASSSSSAPSRPATTSATSCIRAPSTWPRSGSGYEIPSHDLRDTPYIDPRVISRYQEGQTIAAALGELGQGCDFGDLATRGRAEQAVLDLLASA